MPEKETPLLFKKSRIAFVILICVSLTALFIWRETEKTSLNFQTIRWSAWSIFCLFMGLIMMVGRDFFYMVRLKMLAWKSLSWRQSLHVILLWEFASALSPGVVGGTAVAMFILQREKIKLGKATTMVVITAIFDNLFYLLLLPFLFIWLPWSSLFPADTSWIVNGGKYFFWMGYTALAIFNLGLIVAVFYRPKLIQIVVMTLCKLPLLRKLKDKAIVFSEDVILASREVRAYSFTFWIKFFAATGGSWICRFLVINFVLFAFIEMGLLEHLIVLARQLVMWMILIIPATPGGAGIAEVLFTDFLGDIAGTGALVFTMAFIWRSLSSYLYLIIGTILLPRWLKKTAQK